MNEAVFYKLHSIVLLFANSSMRVIVAVFMYVIMFLRHIANKTIGAWHSSGA